MTAPPGRRRSDRAGWPLRDRIRRRRAGLCAALRRSAVAVWAAIAVVLAVGAIGYGVISDLQNERDAALARSTNEARDEARKYQACVQRTSALDAQNRLATVTRSSLLTAARRQRLQARKTTDAELHARFVLGAQLAIRRRASIRVEPLPPCRSMYPTGYRERLRFPDLTPARARP